jgi:hypothetical protein
MTVDGSRMHVKLLARAADYSNHDGGAGPSLSKPFAVMVGSALRHRLWRSGEEKSGTVNLSAIDGTAGKFAGNRCKWAASGVICPQQPVRQLSVVGPGSCEEAVEVSGGPKRRVETLRNLSNNNLAHQNKSSTPASCNCLPLHTTHTQLQSLTHTKSYDL